MECRRTTLPLEHADIVGSVGTGVVGLGTMASSGDDAVDAGEIAYSLRDNGSIGDDIDETRDVFRAKLAKRYGISTDDPDWEDQVDAEVVRRLEQANDHKADFLKLVKDPTFAKYMQAKTVDEIREYAQLRKVLKTVLLTSESFGKGLSHRSARAVIRCGAKFCALNNSTISESTVTVSEPSFFIVTSFRYAGISSYIS